MKKVAADLDRIILLNAQEIKKHLSPQIAASIADIKIHDSITSTIHEIQKQQVIPGEISVCLAEHQTQGTGRLGRTWYSPYAANIYLSFVWLSQQSFTALPKLSLVVGLAVIKVLEELGITGNLKIKWPNDILWNWKKLAGILVDANTAITATALKVSKIIISIGLNVNMLPSAITAPITQPWTSVQEILQRYQDRNKIAAMLLCIMAKILQELEATGKNKILEELWPQYDALYGHNIKLDVGKKYIYGIADGINEYGHLKVRDEKGKIITYAVGTVEAIP